MPVNFTVIFGAAVVNFIIGFLVHGPLFGTLWMRLAHIHPTGKEKITDMFPQMGWNLLANVVCAYVLAKVYAYVHISLAGTPWVDGVTVAFWCWLGFSVTATSMDVIWMGRKKELWFFELAASLVCFIVMGIIIAVFG